MEVHRDDIFKSYDQSNDDKRSVSNEERQHKQTNGHHEAYRTITVSIIDKDATSKDLEEFFTQFGTVEKVRFETRAPKRKRQRYAFVTFASIDSVNSAFLNDPFIIKGKEVKVKPYRLGQDLDQSNGDTDNRADDSNENLRNGARGHNVSVSKYPQDYRTVYVGKFGKTITSKDLEQFFAKFGGVEKVTRKCSAKVSIGKPLGYFAFVTFSSEDSAALAMFNEPHRIKGEKVRVTRFRSKQDHNQNNSDHIDYSNKEEQQRQEWVQGEEIGNDKSDGGSHEASRTVHVGRIQQNTNPKDLGEFFTQFGAVEKVSIVTRNYNIKPLTNAFVTFSTKDSADFAVFHEPHTIKGEKVNVRHCTLKEIQDQDNGGFRADSNEDWQQSHQASVQGNDIGGTISQVTIRNQEKYGEVELKQAEDKSSGEMVVEAGNRTPPLMETPNSDPSMDIAENFLSLKL